LKPNAELRTREYLTDAEVASLTEAAKGNRYATMCDYGDLRRRRFEGQCRRTTKCNYHVGVCGHHFSGQSAWRSLRPSAE
jgi:hypothetical protein